MTRLRLLSLNIHGGRGRDGKSNLTRIGKLMNRLDIDIGVFQEVETRPSRGGAAIDINTIAGSNRPHHATGRNINEGEGWYGNLIVSRFPLLHSVHHDLQTRASFEPRSATDSLFDTPIGKLRVVGTHLSLFSFERNREVQRLIQLMAAVEQTAKYPVLLVGDVNEWLRPSRLLNFLDGLLTAVPCKGTFPSWLPILRLDRVWHDAVGYHITAHRIADKETRMLSDHLPILVEIQKNCT